MSAEKLPVEVVLTDAIEEDLTAEVPIATSNPFRPTVYATENFLEELSNRLQNDVHMLPEGAVRRWKKEMRILLGSSKTGLIYMATSLAETLDLQLKDTNIDGVVFDACVIACDHPVQILTFVRSVSKDKFDTLIQRNDQLSKGVLYSLREFTDEKLNILNGVLDLDDLRDSADFEDKRRKMFGKRSLYVNPRSLQMNPSKCRHLCKAFFVAAAVDHTSTSSDKIVLLKWDDYQLLEKHLDEQKVIVNYASKERAITLMKEVARRLSRSGKTVLRIKALREETIPHKTELATPYVGDCLEDDAFHYVSDSYAFNQLPIIKGKCWLFKGNPAEHLCGVCSLEMSVDCGKLGRVLVNRKLLPEKILTGTFDWKCLWRYVNFAEELRSEFIDSIKLYSKNIARKLISDHDTIFHCTCKTLQTPSAVPTCTLFSAETDKNKRSENIENTTIPPSPHRTDLRHVNAVRVNICSMYPSSDSNLESSDDQETIAASIDSSQSDPDIVQFTESDSTDSSDSGLESSDDQNTIAASVYSSLSYRDIVQFIELENPAISSPLHPTVSGQPEKIPSPGILPSSVGSARTRNRLKHHSENDDNYTNSLLDFMLGLNDDQDTIAASVDSSRSDPDSESLFKSETTAISSSPHPTDPGQPEVIPLTEKLLSSFGSVDTKVKTRNWLKHHSGNDDYETDP